MVIRNKSNQKYIYLAEWISVENKKNHKYFDFAIINNPTIIDVDFENIGGVSGELLIHTYSTINFKIDDIVLWKGYGKGQKYNITHITEDVSENEMGNINSTLRAKYITLRRAG